MKRLASACLIATIAGLLAGCPSQEGRITLAPGEKFRISREAYDTFQNEYLREVGSTNRGAFAVGEHGFGTAYSWCPGTNCVGGASYSYDAIRLCEESGIKCVIFARDDEIVVPYEIIP
jgi:hypothetical protein